jgi:glycosyltransferase involved in cell wall biosynthesis
MKIRIIAPLKPNKQHLHIQCGDYWVKKDLEDKFIKRGYEIVEENADLDFYLFGNYDYDKYITAPKKFCWIYSHPDLIGSYKWDKFSKQFEHIFVLSNIFISQLNAISSKSVLLGASSKEFISRTGDVKYDIMFVGNAQKPIRVEIMNYLIELNKYKICLLGMGWSKKLGLKIKKVDYKGSYIANDKLGEFFNQGTLSFYAAHEDMRKEGFVAVRILDIFRSSENLCISDDNPGLKDIFQSIPIYKNKEELAEQIDYLLEHPGKRRRIALQCRKDVEKWTFDKTVMEIEKWIKKLHIQY